MSELVTIRSAAWRDIDRHADYIGRRDRRAGRRFYDAVQQTLRDLAAMPCSGDRCEIPHPNLAGLRVWQVRGFKNYLIFFLPTEPGITVVRILHGARDIESILEREE